MYDLPYEKPGKNPFKLFALEGLQRIFNTLHCINVTSMTIFDIKKHMLSRQDYFIQKYKEINL